nr:hypothetical protein [Candidatus Sigynarchaeota archaeon]
MGAAKNVFSGIIHGAIAAITYIVMPYIGLSVVKSLDLSGLGVNIDYARLNIDMIIFYIEAIGIILVGLGFAKGSSPKYSKRRSIFALAQILTSGTYAYIIKFSGLSQIPIVLMGFGSIIVTFDTFVFMIFGIVVLNSMLMTFDIIIAFLDQRQAKVISKDKKAKKEVRQTGMYVS